MHRFSIVFAALALGSASATAAILRVNPSAPGPIHDGSSWALAYTTLPAALTASQSGDEIWTAKGVYAGSFTLKSNVALYGGFAGNEMARSQRLPKSNETILDGGAGSAGADASVVTIDTDAAAGTVLDGFTIRNGGRGILCLGTTNVTINGNTIRNNYYNSSTADTRTIGGAIEISNGSPIITRNIIRNDSSTGVEFNPIEGNKPGPGVSGILVKDGSPFISGNSFFDLSSAVATSNGAPTVANNTFSKIDNGISLIYSGAAVVANNTVIGATYSALSVSAMGNAAALIANNIMAFCGYYAVTGLYSGTLTFSHNCTFGNAYGDYADSTIAGTNGNIHADPLLAAAPADVHIRPESPCRDAGDDTAATSGETDIDGQPRILGPHVDIGADEQDGTVYPPLGTILYVTPTGNDDNDGRSWANATRTVSQAAMNMVYSSSTEIWVSEGTYPSFSLNRDAGIYGGFTGTETSRDQRDAQKHISILDGGSSAGVQGSTVVTIPDTATSATVLDGFTIQHGGGTGVFLYSAGGAHGSSPYPVYGFSGAGIFVAGGSPVVTHNIVTQNSGQYTRNESTFSGNVYFVPGNGGGIYVAKGSPSISHNTVTQNSDRNGGGIYVETGTASISDNTVNGNTATATYQFSDGLGDNIDTDQGQGGGICLASNAGACLAARNVINNNAAVDGGGVFTGSSGALVKDNLVAGNTATGHDRSYGSLRTIGSGGGIEINGASSSSAVNNTVAANSSTSAGGISVGTAAVVANNIVTVNQHGGIGRQNSSTFTGSITHNDVYGNTDANYVGYPDQSGLMGNVSVDPSFANAAAGNYCLTSGSPAIGAGDDTFVLPGDLDLDGLPRKLGTHVDMGAYEFPPNPATGILADTLSALRIAGGIVTATPADLSHLNVVTSGGSASRIDLLDAERLVRQAAGLDP